MTEATAEQFFEGADLGLAVYRRVLSELEPLGPVDVRVSKSQVAFRRRRGFAYLWRPGQYLRHADAEVVLSVALGRRDPSLRWKEVVEPTPGRWMHHLEVRDVADLDEAILGLLREAARAAG